MPYIRTKIMKQQKVFAGYSIDFAIRDCFLCRLRFNVNSFEKKHEEIRHNMFKCKLDVPPAGAGAG